MTLQRKISAQIKELEKIANILPCVCVINDIRDASPVWMNNRGLKQLNLTLKELQKLGAKEYFSRYFNEEDAKEYNPKVLKLLQNNNDEETVSCFQQVRINNETDWTWHFTTTKILMRDDDGLPLLLMTLSMPVNESYYMAQKASKLLEENNFLRRNFHHYAKLTPREEEILRHLALGKTSIESAEELFISPQTVDTHRKNIKRKLETNSFHELAKYARAFDLI